MPLLVSHPAGEPLLSFHVPTVHLHLLSDSTGETLEMLAKAALAQFQDTDVVRHFWPMVRSLAASGTSVAGIEGQSGPRAVHAGEPRNPCRRLEEEMFSVSVLPADADRSIASPQALEKQALGQEARKNRPGQTTP